MHGFARQLQAQQMAQKALEAAHHLPAGRQITFFMHPAVRPPIEIGPVRSQLSVRGRRIGSQVGPDHWTGPCGHAADHLLNRCHHFPGLVEKARLRPDQRVIAGFSQIMRYDR
jgi:hypothetical protein